MCGENRGTCADIWNQWSIISSFSQGSALTVRKCICIRWSVFTPYIWGWQYVHTCHNSYYASHHNSQQFLYWKKGDCICLQISISTLHNLGIVTKFEEPKPAKQTDVGETWNWFFSSYFWWYFYRSSGGCHKCVWNTTSRRGKIYLYFWFNWW